MLRIFCILQPDDSSVYFFTPTYSDSRNCFLSPYSVALLKTNHKVVNNVYFNEIYKRFTS